MTHKKIIDFSNSDSGNSHCFDVGAKASDWITLKDIAFGKVKF